MNLLGDIARREQVPSARGMRLVLASASPRRRELLQEAGASFCCLVPQVDERVVGVPAREVASCTAARKAQGALELLGGNSEVPIVACDTTVVLGDEVFGKPAGAADARRMLQALSGRTHQVISGVSILCRGSETSFSVVTDVTFDELTPQQIDTYIESGEPFDKAGAYGIQGAAGAFVRGIEGSYSNVVGLPLAQTVDALRALEGREPLDDDQAKRLVRAQMKAVRKSLATTLRAAASEQACRRIMETPEFERARVIAAYCAIGSELSFEYLLRHFPADKRLAMPCTIGGFLMEFIEVDPLEALPGASQVSFLAQPAALTEVPAGMPVLSEREIDLVLVPGLAFDDQGYRMGYGGGYYDNYLARPGFAGMAMGTFFEQQHYAGELPCQRYDVPLPMVLTQEGARRFV